MKQLLVLLLGAIGAFGQTSGSSSGNLSDRLAQLSEEVRQLKLELAAHRLSYHEDRLKQVNLQLAQIGLEQKQLQEQETAGQQELGQTEMQLARPSLPEEERAALLAVRESLAAESPGRSREENLLLRQKEHLLRTQAEQEQFQIIALRRTMSVLSQPAQPVR